MSGYTLQEIQAVQARFDAYAEVGKQLQGGDGGKSKWGRIVLGSDGGPEVHFAKGAGGKLWHLLKVTVLRPYVYYQNYKVLKELESSIRGCVSADKRDAANQSLRGFSQATPGSRKPYMDSYRSFADYVARFSEQGSRTFQEMNIENPGRDQTPEQQTLTSSTPDTDFLSPFTAGDPGKRSMSVSPSTGGIPYSRSVLSSMARVRESQSPGSQGDLLESRDRFISNPPPSPELTSMNEKTTNDRSRSVADVAAPSASEYVPPRSRTSLGRRKAPQGRPGSSLEGGGAELRSSPWKRTPLTRRASAREMRTVSMMEVPGEPGFVSSPSKRYSYYTPEPSRHYFAGGPSPSPSPYAPSVSVPQTPDSPRKLRRASSLRLDEGEALTSILSYRDQPAEIPDTGALWKSQDFCGYARNSFAGSEGRLRVKLNNYATRSGTTTLHRTLNKLAKRLSLGVNVIVERSSALLGSNPTLTFERFWGFIAFLQPRKNIVSKESKNVGGSQPVLVTAEGAEHACMQDSLLWAAWEAMLECEIAAWRPPGDKAESLDPVAPWSVADSGLKRKKLSSKGDNPLKKEDLRDSLKPAYEEYLRQGDPEEVFTPTMPPLTTEI